MFPHHPGLVVGDRFARALETCRQFLLSVANAEMPGHLTPKGGASDIVQETLTAGYLCREQFHGRTLAELRAWLKGILLNELAMFRRRYRASCRDVAREVPVGATVAGGAHPVAPDQALTELVRAEQTEAVAAAVARLPDEARQVLALRLELRLGFREIGDRLGRTEEAARKLFTRALDQLREIAPDPAA
jgi:RNA polymerase sigma-70 factor (ECF subfamily)